MREFDGETYRHTDYFPASSDYDPAGLLAHDTFTARGWRGVAWSVLGYATAETLPEWHLWCDAAGCEHESEDCYYYDEGETVPRFDQVVAVMVGDDRPHIIDTNDLEPLEEGDYCSGCGQVGCRAYG